MDKTDRKTLYTCSALAAIALLFLAIAGYIVMFFFGKAKESMTPDLTITERTEVYMTPAQIESIRTIGQWEFLAVDCEEMVDTTRRGLIFDDHLVRIYYGTPRLGINLSSLDSTSISTDGNTLILRLPDVQLLDENFIDEARTRTFHESGRWSGTDRNALFRRAQQRMKARTLTSANLNTARQLAEAQLQQLLHAMGFEQVKIEFRPHS